MAISVDQARKALAVARRSSADVQYFFSKLQSPAWIAPLLELKVFNKPLEPERQEGTIRFPDWPESSYLSRMAGLAPTEVYQVICGIPDTDNYVIHQDFLTAALAMPPELSGALAQRAARWIRKQHYLYGLYPEKVGDLISHLAKVSQAKAALQLASALLEVVPKDRQAKGSARALFDEPSSRFDTWHYERVLQKNIPDLQQAAPEQTFRLLCRLLEAAIAMHRGSTDDPFEDYSGIWRPEIANENLRDFKEVLVSAVRDVGVAMSSSDRKQHEQVLCIIGKHQRRVFSRIGLYVLATSPTTNNNDVQAFLQNPTNFEHVRKNPEFNLLLQQWFGKADEHTQEVVLEFITTGPNPETLRSAYQVNTGTMLTNEELGQRMESWRLSWLHLIAASLPERYRKAYHQMVARLGEPQPIQWRIRGGAWAPASPITPEDLAIRSVDGLVKYLHEFVPSNDWEGPSAEGLANVLSQAIAQQPDRYARDAHQFIGLSPTYVSGVLTGFHNAIKEKRAFDWEEALLLCSWVLQQERASGESRRQRARGSWGEARQIIGDLLAEALALDLIPLACSQTVWDLLVILIEDPDPTAERETDYGAGNHLLGMLALNSVRGVALGGIINYALWSQKQGSLEMDKIGAVIDRHLNLTIDLSYCIREVIGLRLPWLEALDAAWTAQRIPIMFPADREDHRLVAWQNYVAFNAPYNNVLPLLRNEYAWAIAHIGKQPNTRGEEAERALAQHLMAFYWRGQLPLDGLVTDFFVCASDALRAEAIEFVGRSLHADSEVPVPDEILKRLMALWEYRVKCADANIEGFRKELAAFGWWFVAKRFEKGWSTEQLLFVLRKAQKITPDHQIVKQLGSYLDEQPEFVLETLYLIIEADKEGWSFYGFADEAREILLKALKRDDTNFDAAKRIIDLLVIKGHSEYRSLLENGK